MKDINEILETLKKENETNFLNDNGLWALMILAILFAPTKQEPPIININIGDGKNV